MIKRALCVLLVIMLAAAPVYAAAGFDDLPEGHWAVSTIELAKENGIIQGYNESGTWLFKPGNNVSRQECMTMLYRTLVKAGLAEEASSQGSSGSEASSEESAPSGAAIAAAPAGATELISSWEETMKACGISEWAYPYCAYGFEQGILAEEDFGTAGESGFGGGVPASRQLIAKWTARAMDYELSPLCRTVYGDQSDIDPENVVYVDALYRKHIMEGSDGLFHGKDGVKRSEMAAVCTRLLGLDPKFAGVSDADPLISVSGTLGSVSAKGRVISFSSPSASFYVPEGTRIALDGTAASLSDLSGYEGSRISVSAYAGGESSIVVQTAPSVMHGTVRSVDLSGRRGIISMELDNGIRITLVTDGNSDVPDVRKNRSYDFISDGILILEMR